MYVLIWTLVLPPGIFSFMDICLILGFFVVVGRQRLVSLTLPNC